MPLDLHGHTQKDVGIAAPHRMARHGTARHGVAALARRWARKRPDSVAVASGVIIVVASAITTYDRYYHRSNYCCYCDDYYL